MFQQNLITAYIKKKNSYIEIIINKNYLLGTYKYVEYHMFASEIRLQIIELNCNHRLPAI